MRAIVHVHNNVPKHWVGDGFYVQTLVNHLNPRSGLNYTHTDPFLLMDYGEPTYFAPNPNYQSAPHGVGAHPHKGFETVTLAYQGSVSHADSAGGSGEINEGDVQWMTAGRGIVHEEFHAPSFGQTGGTFSMVQLWVNLPKANKDTDPKYQSIKRADMSVIDLTDHERDQVIGTLSLIAGHYRDHVGRSHQGAADTFTPINMWDIKIDSEGTAVIDVPNHHNVLMLIQEGTLVVNDKTCHAGDLLQFSAPTLDRAQTDDSRTDDTQGDDSQTDDTQISDLSTDDLSTDCIRLSYSSNEAPAKLLLLSGLPIGEPIAAHGPFVMTTKEELKQAFEDYKNGRFG